MTAVVPMFSCCTFFLGLLRADCLQSEEHGNFQIEATLGRSHLVGWNLSSTEPGTLLHREV